MYTASSFLTYTSSPFTSMGENQPPAGVYSFVENLSLQLSLFQCIITIFAPIFMFLAFFYYNYIVCLYICLQLICNTYYTTYILYIVEEVVILKREVRKGSYSNDWYVQIRIQSIMIKWHKEKRDRILRMILLSILKLVSLFLLLSSFLLIFPIYSFLLPLFFSIFFFFLFLSFFLLFLFFFFLLFSFSFSFFFSNLLFYRDLKENGYT